MQPAKERPVYSANFANHRDATVCSNEQISNTSIILCTWRGKSMQQKHLNQR